MRTHVTPRLASLDVFATTLLATLGLAPLVTGCSSEVVIEDDGGGGSTGNGSVAVGPGSTGSGPSATGNTVGATTGVTTGGGTGGCENPKPILVNGEDTGLDQCDGGQLRRRQALECPTNYPDTNTCCGGCPEGQICNTQGEIACTCVAACTNDTQCGPGQLCMCGDPSGICVSAGCQTGDDCGQGGECTSWDSSLGCLYLTFSCTTPADTCGGDADCDPGTGYFCAVQPDGHRECVLGGCAIGRPFLVNDAARTAGVVARGDWQARDLVPEVRHLAPAVRAELARAWEHTARMEHASIAAFARFSLQLLELGAPHALVEQTNQAMVDETRHARAAFALASAYGGAPVGPGRLAMDGAWDARLGAADIVRLVVREGCIGETAAAVEAGECAARATDPVIREVLARIADDEARHAELAWQTVAWALEHLGADVAVAVDAELSRARAELAAHRASHEEARDAELSRHGIATDRVRANVRADVLRRVVIPCLTALASAARARAAAPHPVSVAAV